MLACQVIKDQDPLVSASLFSSARKSPITVIYNSGCSHCCNWKRTLLLSGGRPLGGDWFGRTIFGN
jgi:hypothetical protein